MFASICGRFLPLLNSIWNKYFILFPIYSSSRALWSLWSKLKRSMKNPRFFNGFPQVDLFCQSSVLWSVKQYFYFVVSINIIRRAGCMNVIKYLSYVIQTRIKWIMHRECTLRFYLMLSGLEVTYIKQNKVFHALHVYY